MESSEVGKLFHKIFKMFLKNAIGAERKTRNRRNISYQTFRKLDKPTKNFGIMFSRSNKQTSTSDARYL